MCIEPQSCGNNHSSITNSLNSRLDGVAHSPLQVLSMYDRQKMANYAGCVLLALPHKATRCHRSTALFLPLISASLGWHSGQRCSSITPHRSRPQIWVLFTHQPLLPPQFFQPAGLMMPCHHPIRIATLWRLTPSCRYLLRYSVDAATPRPWLHLSSASYPAFRRVCSPCGPPRRDANACSHENDGLAGHADEFNFHKMP